MLIKTLKKRIAKLRDDDDFGHLCVLTDPSKDCFWVARNGKVIRRWKAEIVRNFNIESFRKESDV